MLSRKSSRRVGVLVSSPFRRLLNGGTTLAATIATPLLGFHGGQLGLAESVSQALVNAWNEKEAEEGSSASDLLDIFRGIDRKLEAKGKHAVILVDDLDRCSPEGVSQIISTLNTLAANPNLAAIMSNANEITANLSASSRQLNALLRNDMPQLTGKMNRIGDNVVTLTDNLNQLDLQGTLAKVDTTLNYVQLMTEKMNRKDNTLGLLLNDSTLYNNLSNTAGSANNLLIDLKEHPKRYVHFSLFGRKE